MTAVNEWNLARHCEPKDKELVDLIARKYSPEGDQFTYKRFTDIVFHHWHANTLCEKWHGITDGYCPVAWRPIPRIMEILKELSYETNSTSA